MVTYIIKSGDFIKFGRAKNLERRIAAFTTHNPSFIVLGHLEGDFEIELHRHYAPRRHGGEWYKLSDKELNELMESLADQFILYSKIN